MVFIIQKFRLIFTFVRYKPFFPFQTLQGFEDDDEEYIHIQQWALTEGRLKVTLLECSRYVLCYYYIRGKKVYRKCMWAVFVLVPLCVNLYYIICKFFNGKFHKSSPFQLIKNINYILESMLMEGIICLTVISRLLRYIMLCWHISYYLLESCS